MARKYWNFCEGTITDSGGISATDTTVTVTFAANSSVFPSSIFSDVSDYIVMCIDPDGAEHQPELVKVTNIGSGSGQGPYDLTIARGSTEAETSKGGGTAQAWDNGRKVVFPITALTAEAAHA